MSNAAKTYFSLSFITLVLIFVVLFAKCSGEAIAQGASSKDSIPGRVYVIKIKESDLRGKLDTMNGVIGYVGRRLDVDNAEALKQSFAIALNGLLRYAVLDTVRRKY